MAEHTHRSEGVIGGSPIGQKLAKLAMKSDVETTSVENTSPDKALLKLLGPEKSEQLLDKVGKMGPNMGRALKNNIIGDLGCGINEQELNKDLKKDPTKMIGAWHQSRDRVMKMNTAEFESYLSNAKKEVEAVKKALDENEGLQKTLQELQNACDVGNAKDKKTGLMEKLREMLSLDNVSKMMKSMMGGKDKNKKRTSDEVATDFILSPVSYFKFLIIAAAFTPVIGTFAYIGAVPFVAFQVKSLLGADGPDQTKYDPKANLGTGKEGNFAEQLKHSLCPTEDRSAVERLSQRNGGTPLVR